MTMTTAEFLEADQQAPARVERDRCSDCHEPRKLIARGLCTRCYQARRWHGQEMPATKRLPYEPIPGERWEIIPGRFARYQVSDRGRVWSDGGLLRPGRHPHGHLIVSLRVGGTRISRPVHQLVLEAFVGPRPPGLVACHNNGVPDDNRLENLRWDTRSSNQQDTTRHGGWPAMRRAQCPLGHDLMGANLKPSKLAKGIRECLSCARARSNIKADIKGGRPPRDMQTAADLHYAKIMGGTS